MAFQEQSHQCQTTGQDPFPGLLPAALLMHVVTFFAVQMHCCRIMVLSTGPRKFPPELLLAGQPQPVLLHNFMCPRGRILH